MVGSRRRSRRKCSVRCWGRNPMRPHAESEPTARQYRLRTDRVSPRCPWSARSFRTDIGSSVRSRKAAWPRCTSRATSRSIGWSRSKALFPEYAREPSFVERFRREAQAAANLNHPNIVAIYDWGQESGTYFIVMEYVEGRSLRDLIRSEGPLEPGQRRRHHGRDRVGARVRAPQRCRAPRREARQRAAHRSRAP